MLPKIVNGTTVTNSVLGRLHEDDLTQIKRTFINNAKITDEADSGVFGKFHFAEVDCAKLQDLIQECGKRPDGKSYLNIHFGISLPSQTDCEGKPFKNVLTLVLLATDADGTEKKLVGSLFLSPGFKDYVDPLIPENEIPEFADRDCCIKPGNGR